MIAVLFVALLPFGTSFAQSGKYQLGMHYFEVEQPTPLPPGSKQILVEAFSYMCNHCNTFEPYISSWQRRMPENVEFRRIPVVFGRQSWEIYARAYVTAEMMGVANAAHGGVMDRIWKERKVMKSIEELAEFYSGYGVDADKFLSTSKSFAVDAKMRKDQRAVQGYGVKGTPTLILNGKYRIEGSAEVPSYDVMLDVVDYLIAMEEASQALEAANGASSQTSAGEGAAETGGH
jgi:thiol:disulfide interchange protein DsbA